MPRKALQTLSEPMYYVLLALTKERYGAEIMNAVKEISGSRVTIGPGTLYTMLDKFVQNGLIRRTDAALGTKRYIITENGKAAEYFTANVDSTAVYVNASTRFTDGGEFGLGCEMGISTQKLHARGPMGLRELTTYKYIIHGNGQIR